MVSDDDAPPPLQTLAGQTAALSRSSAAHASACEEIATAELTVAPQSQALGKKRAVTTSHAAPLAKGFFDAPKQGSRAKDSKDAMPYIKAKSANVKGPNIPEFLRVEPDPELLKYEAMKEDMLKKLKPDDATIGSVMESDTLMAGFNDPEVMAAVNDVAANPQSFIKYKDNKKVQAFYAQMGQVMSKRLEGAAAQV